MSAFKSLSVLTDFKNEICDNLEAKTGWGKNQLKEIIEEIFKKYHEDLKEKADFERREAQSNW